MLIINLGIIIYIGQPFIKICFENLSLIDTRVIMYLKNFHLHGKITRYKIFGVSEEPVPTPPNKDPASGGWTSVKCTKSTAFGYGAGQTAVKTISSGPECM